MLEELDSIDWASRGVPDIPEVLWGLASPNQEVRIKAANGLETTLAPHPPGILEAYDVIAIQHLLENEIPVLVIPFLVELLQIQDVKAKPAILESLYNMSVYKVLDFDTEYHQKEAQKTFELVKENITVYQTLLHDESPVVKMYALQLFERVGGTL